MKKLGIFLFNMNVIELYRMLKNKLISIFRKQFNFSKVKFSTFANVSSFKINVLSICNSTISKPFPFLLMYKRHKSYVDYCIASFSVWCLWYVLNQWASASETSYKNLIILKIAFPNSNSTDGRMKNFLVNEMIDCT